ncbi:MAG: BspA family leucine-rich repeat surface protein, partial [Lachnospiraceae bacterium]|nr:BspA family leucine-rich repeat surface protein [Lachnospiraceae bacterium]
ESEARDEADPEVRNEPNLEAGNEPNLEGRDESDPEARDEAEPEIVDEVDPEVGNESDPEAGDKAEPKVVDEVEGAVSEVIEAEEGENGDEPDETILIEEEAASTVEEGSDAAANWYDSYTYGLSGSEMILKKYRGSERDITVPASATIGEDTYAVGVDEAAFLSTSIVSIRFEAGVKLVSGYDLFWGCKNLTSVDLSGLNTSNTENMGTMFSGCASLTSIDLSVLDTSNVTDMHSIFSGCSSLTGVDLSGLNTSNVTDMNAMFSGCSSLMSVDLSGLNTSNVTDMNAMFSGCTSLTSVDLSGLNTGNTTSMGSMFSGCTSLTSVDLSGLNTSKVKYMDSIFWDCANLASVDLSGLNTGEVVYMNFMFSGCTSLTSVDLSGIDTGNVKNMCYMFSDCSALTSLDLSGFDTSNVQTMKAMFQNCSSLTSLSLTNFNTQDVDTSYAWNKYGDGFSNMFSGCSSLMYLDLSSFNLTYHLHDMSDFLKDCTSIEELKTPYSYDYNSIKNAYLPFPMYEKIEEGRWGTTAYRSFGYYSRMPMNMVIGKRHIAFDKFVSVSLVAESFPYTGSAITPSISSVYEGSSISQGDYTVEYQDNVEVGTAKVIVTGQGEYEGMQEKTFRITPRNLSEANVNLSAQAYSYDGTAKKPGVTVKYGNRVLKPEKDYTLSYRNEVNAGKAEAIVKGKGNYTGSKTVPYTIKKISLSGASVTLSKKTYKYDGKAKKPVVKVKVGGKTLTANVHYTVSYANNVNAGTATATVTGKGNYDSSKSVKYTIQGKSFSKATITLSTKSYVYNGKAKKPKVSVKFGRTKLSEKKHYSVAYSQNTDAGKAKVIVTGKGLYLGKKTATFTIKKAPFSKAAVSIPAKKCAFTGGAMSPSVLVKYAGKTLSKDKDYTVSYKNNTKVGKATATVVGKGNFSGSKKVGFTITKGSQTITVRHTKVGVGKTVDTEVAGTVGKVTYSIANKSIATVNAKGMITGKKSGTTTLTVKAAGNGNYNKGVAKVSITVANLPGATASFVAKNVGAIVQLKWQAVTGASGYYLYLDNAWIATVTNSSTTAYNVIREFTEGKTYEFKIVAYSSEGTSPDSKTAKVLKNHHYCKACGHSGTCAGCQGSGYIYGP